MHRTSILIISLIFALAAIRSTAAARDRFEGELKLRFLDDGRTSEVLESFVYVDPRNVRWRVPAGAKTDGASVPRWAWSFVPPMAGKHLRAAVLHDHFCETRDRPWQDVHRVFYDALITLGIGSFSAKVMYSAVYGFGPKWLPNGARIRGARTPPDKAKAQLQALRDWIKTNEPSLDEIEARILADLQRRE